jgi:NAD(P)-dependent dehydrogenase (short-subunit alcohol dehydrogenase family)
MSKVALTALTRVQQKSIDSDKTKEGVIVSAVCPGYCKTDMARGGGFLTAKQGEFFKLLLAMHIRKSVPHQSQETLARIILND